ncbi:topoisomerase DNA-binding C4 zinc finger domain-containing protein [Aliiglaciecola sp. M165]|uniref:DNA topoisomerase family protein n=1 Tax=Aliiglaciecola sp. M165 TaxID=2593649 RepID=UPI0011802591|nr:topoisomerase DNA-binding C4 zinc finger domain-containing protein [Aliiglaciecola sp. M165]TRY28930.1 hypothetical protein FM019_20290 [Aliiglaciecola sp. M165]
MSKIDHSLFAAHEHALEGNFGECPECNGKLAVRRGKTGAFLGCEHYPSCHFSKPLHDNHTEEIKQIEGSECPDCGKVLSIKKGRYGLFIGCSGFPDCHHIEGVKQQTDVHVHCPKCATGKLIQRTNKYGKTFYSCDAYPKCKYLLNHKPVAKSCPKCHWAVMVEKQKGEQRIFQCPQKNCLTSVSDEAQS